MYAEIRIYFLQSAKYSVIVHSLSAKGCTMTTESQAETVAPKGEDAARGRSTIEFPYFDLAVKQVGGTAAATSQLAVKLDMAVDGGGFRMRLMTGKTFGLIDYERRNVELTELGIRIVDSQYERAAKVEAFMFVPLYKALFEKLNGQTLPPPAAVERMAEQLGVAPKQKDKARLAFMRSAKTAGLFELSTERLSLPPNVSGFNADAPKDKPDQKDTKRKNDDGEPPDNTLKFEVPIPGKPSATVIVPADLDADDWEMLSSMMTTYINRWKKFTVKPAQATIKTGDTQ
jgi:hypothetical protein